MTSVIKLNDKRFYFSGGVVSLPFSHRLIMKLNDLKEDFGKNIEKVILEKKWNIEVRTRGSVQKQNINFAINFAITSNLLTRIVRTKER